MSAKFSPTKSAVFVSMVLALSLGACNHQDSDSSVKSAAVDASLPKFNIDHRVSGQLPTAPAGIEGETFIFAKSEDGITMKAGSGSFQTEWGISSINLTTLAITTENFQSGTTEYSPDSELQLWCEQLNDSVIGGLNSAKGVDPLQDHEGADKWSSALRSLQNKKCN